jgi:hypothetical protein
MSNRNDRRMISIKDANRIGPLSSSDNVVSCFEL